VKLSPVTIVANAAPWLAPLPTAWLVYERTLEHFGWPVPVAAVTGAVLEVLGVAIMHTALTLWSWNREKRKPDPPAPTWIGVVLVGVYFVAAELLTVFLETVDGALVAWSPAVFPVLSVAAVAVLALRADHERRLSEVERTKAEAKANRARLKAERQRIEREQAEPEPEPPPLPSFVCDLCNSSFETQNGLNAHKRVHNGKGE
jgi:hypothetical protein